MTGTTSSNPNTLGGRVVVITGGNGGIGFGVAEGVTAAGAVAVIWGRDSVKSEWAVEMLRDAGRTSVAITADLSSEDSVMSAMEQTVEMTGGFDAFVANAGIPGRASKLVDLEFANGGRF